MRAVIQRASWARVEVDGREVSSIGPGIALLLGVEAEDTEDDLNYLVEKTLGLRIFADDAGQMNRSLLQTGGELLVVSQFTLLGDVRKGRRPSFGRAMAPEPARALYEAFVERAEARGVRCERGVFGASMRVSLENDGPVTILLDSRKTF